MHFSLQGEQTEMEEYRKWIGGLAHSDTFTVLHYTEQMRPGIKAPEVEQLHHHQSIA
jgi:hypothetical protein